MKILAIGDIHMSAGIIKKIAFARVADLNITYQLCTMEAKEQD